MFLLVNQWSSTFPRGEQVGIHPLPGLRAGLAEFATCGPATSCPKTNACESASCRRAPQRCSWRGEETVVILVTIDHDWSLLVYRSPDILWQDVMCSNLPEWTLPNAESTTCTWLNFGSIAVQAFRFLNGFSSGQTIHPEADIEFWWLRTSWRTYKRILNTRQRSYIDPYANFFTSGGPLKTRVDRGLRLQWGSLPLQPMTQIPGISNLLLGTWNEECWSWCFPRVSHASFPIWCA